MQSLALLLDAAGWPVVFLVVFFVIKNNFSKIFETLKSALPYIKRVEYGGAAMDLNNQAGDVTPDPRTDPAILGELIPGYQYQGVLGEIIDNLNRQLDSVSDEDKLTVLKQNLADRNLISSFYKIAISLFHTQTLLLRSLNQQPDCSLLRAGLNVFYLNHLELRQGEGLKSFDDYIYYQVP